MHRDREYVVRVALALLLTLTACARTDTSRDDADDASPPTTDVPTTIADSRPVEEAEDSLSGLCENVEFEYAEGDGAPSALEARRSAAVDHAIPGTFVDRSETDTHAAWLIVADDGSRIGSATATKVDGGWVMSGLEWCYP